MATPTAIDKRIVTEWPRKFYRPVCQKCSETFSVPPKDWVCPKDGTKCWQPYERATSGCTSCGGSLGVGNQCHCSRCGFAVCKSGCGDFFMQLPGATEKTRVCKCCAFPAVRASMVGTLTKVSRDATGKETSRNARYFELRRNILMYAVDNKSAWKGFMDIEGSSIANEAQNPNAGFTIYGGSKLPHPVHLIATSPAEKNRWVNSILAISSSGVGGQEFDSTEADGFSGFLNLVDGQKNTRLFFRLKGTELLMAKDKTDESFDGILLHGGTAVRDDPRDMKSLVITGPRLPNQLLLVAPDEYTKSAWKSSILCAQRGGNKHLRTISHVAALNGSVGSAADETQNSSSPLQQQQQQNVNSQSQQPPPSSPRTGTSSSSSSSSATAAAAGGGGTAVSARDPNALPALTMKTLLVEGQRGSGNPRIPAGTEPGLALHEHILLFQSSPKIDLRGATVAVDPHRARTVTISGSNAVPPLSLWFQEDQEFSYWKECMQCVAAGKPMPFRKFRQAEAEMEGTLTKVGTEGAKNKRYFVLYDHFLQYGEDEKAFKSNNVKGEFDVLGCEITDSAQHTFGILVTGGVKIKRSLIVIAANEEERSKWKRALTEAAGAFRDKPKQQLPPPRQQQVAPPPVPQKVAVVGDPPHFKGIGLQRGEKNLIDLQVIVEISRERQRDFNNPVNIELTRWHGATIPLNNLDAATVNLEALQVLIESVVFENIEKPKEEGEIESFSGVLLVPGRYVAFRNLKYDQEDIPTSGSICLQDQRGDDDTATCLHRLPDSLFLDEIPLRYGDKLVWKDVGGSAGGASPLRTDRARSQIISLSGSPVSASNSPTNNNANSSNSNSRSQSPLQQQRQQPSLQQQQHYQPGYQQPPPQQHYQQSYQGQLVSPARPTAVSSYVTASSSSVPYVSPPRHSTSSLSSSPRAFADTYYLQQTQPEGVSNAHLVSSELFRLSRPSYM